MPFEWDENKRKWNIDNRQMDFTSADDFDMSTGGGATARSALCRSDIFTTDFA